MLGGLVNGSCLWCSPTSTSSRFCHSGLEAASDRARRAASRLLGLMVDCPNISPIRQAEWDGEAMKAAGACRAAPRKLMPPLLLGKEALSHDQSDIRQPRMVSRVSLVAASKTEAAWRIRSGGHVHKMYENFGRVRH